MKLDEVYEKLQHHPDWRSAPPPAKEAFLMETGSIQYGESELRNAFSWWYRGWVEGVCATA